jgi:hypothetical protein
LDYYLLDSNVIERLVIEWKSYGSLVIAYDYDNTVFDYHGDGHEYLDIPNLLRECKAYGCYLIVFSASESSRYSEISSYLKSKDIPYDSINSNPPFITADTGKIYYNVLLDDRAGLRSAYDNLKEALRIMKEN